MDFRVTFAREVVIMNAYDGQMAEKAAKAYRKAFPEVGRIQRIESDR